MSLNKLQTTIIGYVCMCLYVRFYSKCTIGVRCIDCLFMKYIFTVDQDILSTTVVSIEKFTLQS